MHDLLTLSSFVSERSHACCPGQLTRHSLFSGQQHLAECWPWCTDACMSSRPSKLTLSRAMNTDLQAGVTSIQQLQTNNSEWRQTFVVRHVAIDQPEVCS